MKKTIVVLAVSFLAGLSFSACDNGKDPWHGGCGDYYPYVKLNHISVTGGEADAKNPGNLTFGITFDYRFLAELTRSNPGFSSARALSCVENGSKGLDAQLKSFIIKCSKSVGGIEAGGDISSLMTITAPTGSGGSSEINTLEKWLAAVNANTSPGVVSLLYGGITAVLPYADWEPGEYTITVRLEDENGIVYQQNLPKLTIKE